MIKNTIGLDMSLYKKHYVKNWEHSKEKTVVTATKGGKPIKGLKADRVAYIVEDVAYWRKANMIHDWFVQNAQGGEDDCRNAYVSYEQLRELLDTCKKVLDSIELVEGKIQNGTSYKKVNGKIKKIPIMKNRKYIKDSSVCEELLPTTSGFFFGKTNYDQYYYDDVKYTYDMLMGLLSEEKADKCDYEYHSSW